MMCTDDKRWKAGKRKAEKDELVGANFFITLQAPETTLDTVHLYVYVFPVYINSCSVN